jgi:hypothetical protein
MDREIKARREYAKKFAFMSKPETNRFYNQSFLSAKVDEMVPEGIMKSSELGCIAHSRCFDFAASGQTAETSSIVGESYFVSKAMFDSLNVETIYYDSEGSSSVFLALVSLTVF